MGLICILDPLIVRLPPILFVDNGLEFAFWLGRVVQVPTIDREGFQRSGGVFFWFNLFRLHACGLNRVRSNSLFFNWFYENKIVLGYDCACPFRYIWERERERERERMRSSWWTKRMRGKRKICFYYSTVEFFKVRKSLGDGEWQCSFGEESYCCNTENNLQKLGFWRGC